MQLNLAMKDGKTTTLSNSQQGFYIHKSFSKILSQTRRSRRYSKISYDSAYVEGKDSMKTNDDLYDLDLFDYPLDDFRDSDDYLY